MPEKKNEGETFRWERGTMKAREKLGLTDRSLRPWTARPGVLKRGISVQASWPNFIDELLDRRVMADNQRREKLLDADPDPALLADVGQEAS